MPTGVVGETGDLPREVLRVCSAAATLVERFGLPDDLGSDATLVQVSTIRADRKVRPDLQINHSFNAALFFFLSNSFAVGDRAHWPSSLDLSLCNFFVVF